MPSTLACPDETELLALAMGEPVAAAVTAHVDGCASCQTKLDRLQAEVALLRQNHGHGTTPPSTEHDPAVDHDGEPSSAGTTQDWTSADPAGTTDTDPFGPEAVAAARDRAEGQGAMPDAIGKYKVVGWLGAGGEADVYRVVHLKLGNDLVLKLSRRRVGADDQSGLVEEGKLLVDLEHPNLVRIYDLDFHDDRPFLVMEYVHGRNLEQYAREEPVTQRRAAALVAKLAGVMAVAHRHGIIHCDIKPKNILIDKLGEPRLIDFGMARLRHAWSDCAPTSWGGTVAYMAPEQARLEIDRIGPRSDIFALGGVLYFLLTGQAPFPGETHERGLGPRPPVRLRGRRPPRRQGPAPARANLPEGHGRRSGRSLRHGGGAGRRTRIVPTTARATGCVGRRRLARRGRRGRLEAVACAPGGARAFCGDCTAAAATAAAVGRAECADLRSEQPRAPARRAQRCRGDAAQGGGPHPRRGEAEPARVLVSDLDRL